MPKSADAHALRGKVLLEKKNICEAISELSIVVTSPAKSFQNSDIREDAVQTLAQLSE